MLESTQERYEDLRQDFSEYLGYDRPDGKNAGISLTGSAIAFVAALGASLVAREVLEAGWRTTLDREPPKNPASHEVDWKDAILWGATSGALVGVARILSRRLSTRAYRKFRS